MPRFLEFFRFSSLKKIIKGLHLVMRLWTGKILDSKITLAYSLAERQPYFINTRPI